MKILKFLWNHLKKTLSNERGTWGNIVAAAVTAGTAYTISQGGKGGDMNFQQLPDYPESEQARKDWGARLQEWGAMPGYGAIAPDWGDIWERSKSKISRFYGGGPAEGGGLVGKVKASAARRGVSESPAMERNIATLGMQEGIQLGDLATEMGLQEALFGEKGRQNWLTSLQNLASMKPAFATSAGTTGGGGNMTALSGLGEGLGGILGSIIQQNQINEMQNLLAGGGGSPTGQIMNYGGQNYPVTTPNYNYGYLAGGSSPTITDPNLGGAAIPSAYQLQFPYLSQLPQ